MISNDTTARADIMTKTTMVNIRRHRCCSRYGLHVGMSMEKTEMACVVSASRLRISAACGRRIGVATDAAALGTSFLSEYCKMKKQN